MNSQTYAGDNTCYHNSFPPKQNQRETANRKPTNVFTSRFCTPAETDDSRFPKSVKHMDDSWRLLKLWVAENLAKYMTHTTLQCFDLLQARHNAWFARILNVLNCSRTHEICDSRNVSMLWYSQHPAKYMICAPGEAWTLTKLMARAVWVVNPRILRHFRPPIRAWCRT